MKKSKPEIVDEYNKDQAYADAEEFAQIVIWESERFDQNKQNVTGRSVESLGLHNKLRADARELLDRILARRDYVKQLILLAFDFGKFCMIVDARSSLTSEMKEKLAPLHKSKAERRRRGWKELLKETNTNNLKDLKKSYGSLSDDRKQYYKALFKKLPGKTTINGLIKELRRNPNIATQ